MPLIERDSICQFLYRGNATTVYMAGDAATGWTADASPMTRLSSTDVWIYSDVYELDARLEYKFVVNGTDWILDPRNPATCMGGFGPSSELAMPSYVHAPELQYYPDIPHGELHDTSFSSSILGNTRTIRVYTPPGYSQAGSDSFEVAVLHDGLEWLNYAEGDNALDYLIHHGRVRPLIAVFVPPVNREPEYVGAQQDEFAEFISTELMPYVDARYRTQRRPMSRATAGISNGGNIALWIMAQYPQEFGNAASYSGAIQPTTASAFDVVPASSRNVYVDVGTYESSGFQELSRDFRDMLQARGYSYLYIEWHEGHSWGSWGAHLDNALEFFFPGPAVGVQEEHRVPTAFTLYQNYPNPFNPNTTIRYGLPERFHVTLTIYNMLGQQVGTLVQGEQEAGYHEAVFDASGLASGVYLYRLQAGDFVEAKKFVVLK
jgi:enterochelin esterase family protein